MASRARLRLGGRAAAVDPIGKPGIPGGDRPSYMWTSRCTTGLQHVSFLRTIFLPGPPEQLAVVADPRSIPGWPRTIKSIELFANGHLLAGSRSSDSIDYEAHRPDAKLAFLHFGRNKLELEVTKSPLPASLHPCGAPRSKRIGVRFALEGGPFPTDLAVSAAQAATKYFRVFCHSSGRSDVR